MHPIDDVVRLLRGYLKGEIHPDTSVELYNLLNKYPTLVELVRKLDSEESLNRALEDYKRFANQEAEEDDMLAGILSRVRETDKPMIVRRYWPKIGIAASVFLLLFIGFYVFSNRFINNDETVALVADFDPGSNKAILTTSDGREVTLSSSYEGIIVGDQLVYEDGSVLLNEEEIDMDGALTLTTPRGGQYQVSLSDGTRVWLNADSKLYYPRVFSGNTRTVQMEGEAYFEVAKNEQKPFIVQTNRQKVEVLGTHFNVNAYSEEPISAVSLLEGKVKVSLANQAEETLLPGQQSLVKNDVIYVQKIDIAESVAWKNGEFMFNNESLSSVMRKLARWYDIDVDLASDVKDISIWGSVSRYDTFDEVLQVIKMIDEHIQFKIEGRRVSIMR
ncbi:DUF4974 domain-containing protein [Sphingobacterium sp. SGG-5]|uniref:FecR family protein n=1 Tax=Sphingobacterium sp. SGG-5 TaxID=2710881 RepID=UPI0013E9C638|nr:FecR family protein [Sphingobacterium sp. SGG-5]NGM60657.1 DUF4974 domain-containing protein [Sphingobacterium sp. SGG-5]